MRHVESARSVRARLGDIGERNRVPRGSFVHVLPTPARTVTPDEFEQRLAPVLAHLRGVLIARHGIEVGLDVHAEVSSFAWEQRDMVCGLGNPAGYLFRVSQSKARRYRRWDRTAPLPVERAVGLADGDPRLDDAMAQLTKDERTVCVLVHGYGYRYELDAVESTDAVGDVKFSAAPRGDSRRALLLVAAALLVVAGLGAVTRRGLEQSSTADGSTLPNSPSSVAYSTATTTLVGEPVQNGPHRDARAVVRGVEGRDRRINR